MWMNKKTLCEMRTSIEVLEVQVGILMRHFEEYELLLKGGQRLSMNGEKEVFNGILNDIEDLKRRISNGEK